LFELKVAADLTASFNFSLLLSGLKVQVSDTRDDPSFSIAGKKNKL
jgi:hypothetical protein